MDVFLLQNFRTSKGLLKHFYLTQLILSDQVDEKDLGVKLSLLLYRYDSNTYLSEITSEPLAVEILQKQNTRDLWQKMSVKRFTEFKEELPLSPS